LALYGAADGVPQVVALAAEDCLSLIDRLCRRVYQASQDRGGVLPLLALREIIENLLHASFRDVVVSVLPDGSVVVSDRGPGIPDKTSALRPGFTTASPDLRRYIRGVGSGLAVARESLEVIGGSLRLEDNLGGGTVVSLLVPRLASTAAPSPSPGPPASLSPTPEGTPSRQGEYSRRQRRPAPGLGTRPGRAVSGAVRDSEPSLTLRQEQLLRFVAARAEAGPSAVAVETGLSVASAYRELVALERAGLLQTSPGGKRRLSPRGEQLLAALTDR
jgi:hypothetical protein